MEPASSTPEELRKWIRDELARWTKSSAMPVFRQRAAEVQLCMNRGFVAAGSCDRLRPNSGTLYLFARNQERASQSSNFTPDILTTSLICFM